jgi:hypothetical protein
MNITALATIIRNQRFDGAILVAEALEGIDGKLRSLQDTVETQAEEVEAIAPSSLGNVYIQNVIPTYESPTDNENVLVKLTITYKPPLPLFNFDRVKVYLEVPDGSEQIRLVEEFPYAAAGSATSVAVFYEPPTSSEDWRVYVVSGDVDGDFNPLRLFTQSNPSPSYQVTVAPLPDGGSGTEWTSNVTNLTASVEYGVNEAGIQLYRIYGTFTDPSDITFRGVRFVADDGADQWQLTYVPKDNGVYVSPWYPVPEDSTPITVYAQSQGPHYRMNSIVPGTTPSANVTVERQVGLGGLKLTLVDTGTFNTDEFEIDPGEGFRVKVLNADKIQTGILKVGGGSNKPGQLGVFSATDTLIGWIGEQDDGGAGYWYGAWFKQLWVGGNDPSDAPLYTNANGELVINSITSGGRIFMNPTYGFFAVQDTTETGDPTQNKASVIDSHSVSTVYGVGASGFRGAFMQSDAGYGEMFVTDGFGNTQIYMKADVNQLQFRNSSSATAPASGYTALRPQSGDAMWYDPDTASWRKLAYYDEVGKLTGSGQTWTQVNNFSAGITGLGCAFSGEISGSNIAISALEIVDTSHNINGNSYEVNGTTVIDSNRRYFPVVISQSAEPTLQNGELGIWIDTDTGISHVIFRSSAGTQLKVALG